jgi:hypothetical protein
MIDQSTGTAAPARQDGAQEKAADEGAESYDDDQRHRFILLIAIKDVHSQRNRAIEGLIGKIIIRAMLRTLNRPDSMRSPRLTASSIAGRVGRQKTSEQYSSSPIDYHFRFMDNQPEK